MASYHKSYCWIPGLHMPAHRFFSNTPLSIEHPDQDPTSPENQASRNLRLDGDEAHHLITVMRARIGDEVEIIDGKGRLAIAQIVEKDKKHVILKIENIITEEPSQYSRTLILALLRHGHIEYALEKCTEVGITDFILFPGARSDRDDISQTQFKRYQTILESSIKQCGRLFIPTLHFVSSLKKAVEGQSFITFGDLSSSSLPIHNITIPQKASIVIGPEAGFSEEEYAYLRSIQATGIRFHKNILRAETAAVVASTIVGLYQDTSS